MSYWPVRPVLPADESRIVEIMNAVTSSPLTLAEYRERTQLRQTNGPLLRLAVDDPTGRPLGTAVLYRDPWRPVGELAVQIHVDPADCRQGIGSALYTAVEAQAREWKAVVLGSFIRDDRPESRRFAESRGFVVADHYCRSRQDLQQFDPVPFQHYLERVRAAGYRLGSLAELPWEEGVRRFYEVDMECAKDEPGKAPDQPPIPFDSYAKADFSGPKFDPEGVFFAEKEGEWAAVTGLVFPSESEEAWVTFTGVLKPHRGQGLAQALKLLAAEYARQRGLRYIGAGNHENNPAMLAINRKFGFRPLPGSFALRKRL